MDLRWPRVYRRSNVGLVKIQFSILFYSFDSLSFSYDNTLIWMMRDLTDEKSTLVQLMAWVSLPNHFQSVSPKQTTFEEDWELFKTFLQFYVYDLRFKAAGLTTFFYWVLNTAWVQESRIRNSLFSTQPNNQATRHYPNQCRSRSMLPYGINRPQWVNSLRPRDAYINHHCFR